jgi:hypothetical protein
MAETAPDITDEVQTSLADETIGAMGNPKRSLYRRLRIALPPDELERRMRGALSDRLPSRQHDVRGHFRRLSSGRRVWIHAHVRGDPSLGIISKEYVLDREAKKAG